MQEDNKDREERPISLLLAITPLVMMVALLSFNVFVFKDDALGGSNQVILILSAAFAAACAGWNGTRWSEMQRGVIQSLSIAMPAILILLMVGALSGTWLLSGIIPTMIYIGLQLLNPDVFLFAACIITALVSVFTGSSWTTSATIGIALMGIGQVLNINPGMIAGAILSGAYFGDKMSPLSDTTNLAAASTGTELFTHIRYMLYTTVPSFTIAMIFFIFAGFMSDTTDSAVQVDAMLLALDDTFQITAWVLLAPAAVIFMIIKKVPALPALFVGSLLGILFAFIFQGHQVTVITEQLQQEDFHYYRGIMQAVFGDTSYTTGQESLDSLLSSGGMAGMLNTIWLIITAMIFGGIMEASGFLHRVTQALISRAKSVGALVSATAGTCIFTNATTSDQYLSLVLPGRMYNTAFEERGLASQNLSRTLEDAGTATSVLIPWNTCGAYHATVLGVATLTYAPYAIFSIISPIMTVAFATFGIRIAMQHIKKKPADTTSESSSGHTSTP